jgi:signal transduction histidine kinase
MDPGPLLARGRHALVGELMADLTHECNNHLAFVLSNLANLAEYADDLKRLVTAYRTRLEAAGGRGTEVAEVEREVDADFILDDSGRAAREALEGARRLRETVSMVRHLGDSEIEPRPLEVDKLVIEATAVLARQLRQHAHLVVSAEPGPVVMGRAGELMHVIVALLKNAVEAFGARPREQNHIHVSLESRGPQVAVLVADDGPGVDAAVGERVFEPLFSTKGTLGLGLAIARASARRAGGDVILEPCAVGARFALLLPAADE